MKDERTAPVCPLPAAPSEPTAAHAGVLARLRAYLACPYNLLALLWAIGCGVGLFALYHGRGFDDPFITYRYAQNIASGQGFVYNPGEQVLSTTTPLYALILAGGDLVGLPIPLFSNALGCLGLAMGGWVFWRLGQTWHTPLAGAVGLLLYPTFPLLVSTMGAETAFYLMLVLLGFLSCARRHYSLMAVWLALATLTRGDSVLAVGVAGLYILVEHVQQRRGGMLALPWHALLIYGLLLLPWVLFASSYFGSPLPATLAAKQQQGSIPESSSFLAGLLAFGQAYWNFSYNRIAVLLALMGLSLALVQHPRWLLLVGWSAVYIVAYTLLGVSSYFWYNAPVIIGMLALVGLGVHVLVQMVRPGLGMAAATGVAAVVLPLLLYTQLVTLSVSQNDTRMEIYRQVGEWLHTNTPPAATVGTIEIGIIGYYAQRPMIDFAGLLQPAIARQLSPTSGYNTVAAQATLQYQPDYIVFHRAPVSQLASDPRFQQHCQPQQTFEHPRYSMPLVIYACTW